MRRLPRGPWRSVRIRTKLCRPSHKARCWDSLIKRSAMSLDARCQYCERLFQRYEVSLYCQGQTMHNPQDPLHLQWLRARMAELPLLQDPVACFRAELDLEVKDFQPLPVWAPRLQCLVVEDHGGTQLPKTKPQGTASPGLPRVLCSLGNRFRTSLRKHHPLQW